MSERQRLAKAARQHLEGLKALGVTELPFGGSSPAAHAGKRPVRPSEAGDGPAERSTREAQLADLAARALTCTRCPLYKTRTKCVISDGTPYAKLMFVGEAPGRDEDLQGVPFVGAAGQLLTKMILAMGLKREDVYICNVLKDRPPGNRTPLPEEMEACLPFLQEQIRIVQPSVICVLGSVAAKALLGPYTSITSVRGQWRAYEGVPLMPTFHPAYLLRNPAAKKDVWEDLKKINALLAQDAPS